MMDSLNSTNVIKKSEYQSKYYAWVTNEKNVTIEFGRMNDTSIIFPIHLRGSRTSKGLYEYFKNKKFENVIIDPSTQRLSYDAFRATVGLENLTYSPKEGVISLSYLKDTNKRKIYIYKWYQTVSEGENLILPYHYISNRDQEVINIEEWININIKLAKESLKLVDDSKKKYAMISVCLKDLIENEKIIIESYKNLEVDGFVVQVADLRQLSRKKLKGYFDFMKKMKSEINKPIIIFKVPISLGLTLISRGIHGFSLGLSGKEYFNEDYIKYKSDGSGGNRYFKYYFPQLLSFFTCERIQKEDFKRIYTYFKGCTCQWCSGLEPLELADGDKITQLHSWQKLTEEVERINKIEGNKKEEYIKNRIKSAISEFEDIPKNIMEVSKSNFNYKLLKMIFEVMQ